MKHTPTPWMAIDGRWIIPVEHSDRKIGGSSNKKDDRENYAANICTTGSNENRFAKGESGSNAAFIVRAVNSHDLLVEAVKSFIEYDSSDESDGLAMMISYNGALKKCKAALAAVEAK